MTQTTPVVEQLRERAEALESLITTIATSVSTTLVAPEDVAAGLLPLARDVATLARAMDDRR